MFERNLFTGLSSFMKTLQSDSNLSAKGSTLIGGKRFVWGSRTFIMGVVNVTPDSFSRDGVGLNVNAAVELALNFEEQGADIIDVGGESTRPPSIYEGAELVTEETELLRVLPVIQAMERVIGVPISVDTSKAKVASQAIEAGASMVNDVWALQRDPDIKRVVSDKRVPVVLMHNQNGVFYRDLVPDIVNGLRHVVDSALNSGIDKENVIVDPGIGFGKTAEHNLEIIRRLPEFTELSRPMLVGMSRKSTIGEVLDLPVEQRLEGTAATVALSIVGGADIVRVHDVDEMVKVAKMSDAIVRGWSQNR